MPTGPLEGTLAPSGDLLVKMTPHSLLLGQQALGVPLRLLDEVIPVLLDVRWGTTLDRHMIGGVDCIDHVDGVPRANLGAVLAADTPIQIDVAEGLQALNLLAGYFIDAVDRADFEAGFTPGASVGVNHGQDLGNHLTRLASQRRCCHEILSGVKKLAIHRSPGRPAATGI